MLAGSTVGGADTSPNVVTLNLEPTPDHSRNSEGAFVTLASSRIVFCYTQYYGRAVDESPARIVRIHADDPGRTWSEPAVVVANTGGKNVMSVSLLWPASGKFAFAVRTCGFPPMMARLGRMRSGCGMRPATLC